MHPKVRRLAILGAWAPHRAEDAIARAARRLGITAQCFDVLRRTRQLGPLAGPLLERGVQRFDPDFILCTWHAWGLGPERLTRVLRGRRSALWFFDAAPHEGTIALARLCDAMYLTYAEQREQYRAAGVTAVRFLPQGLDPDRDRPATRVRPADACEVSFIGSGQYPHRWPLLQAVGRAAELRIWGPGWEGAPPDLHIAGGQVVGERFAEIVAASQVSLGANAVPAQDVATASASDRMWKILGVGGAYLGPWIPGIEAFAAHEEHCRWYRDADDCVTQLRELLADPAGRRAMAERGRAHALAHHTYDARLGLLLADQEMPLPATTV